MKEISAIVSAIGLVVASVGVVVYGIGVSFAGTAGYQVDLGFWMMIGGAIVAIIGIVAYARDALTESKS